MLKWARRFVYLGLIWSFVTGIGSTITHAEDKGTTILESVSPQTLLEQSIQSVKLADQNGKLNTASYQVQFALDSTEFPAIDTIFPDRSGEHLIVVYELKDNLYVNGKFQDRTIKVASIQVKDGKKVWDTVVAKKNLTQSVYNVQSNGEIFLTSEDDTTFYLHTINEKTGKITRKITQSLPSKSTFLAWDHWLIDHNQLLVSYSINNKSTLRYFDATGKLLKTRTVSGIVRGAQGNRILVTNGSVFRYTFEVQDDKGNHAFQKSVANEGFFWEAYLLPDLSVAIESQLEGKIDNTFRLIKYDAKGKKQWQHTIQDEYSPYLPDGNQIIAILGQSKKIFWLNDHGKVIRQVKGNKDESIQLKQNAIYFEGESTRIVNKTTQTWLAELMYNDSSAEMSASWLGKKRFAIVDRSNNIIAVIRIENK